MNARHILLTSLLALIYPQTTSLADVNDYTNSRKYPLKLIKDKSIYCSLEKARNLSYQSESKGQDHWKLPAETEAEGGGDCEDLASWLQHDLSEKGLDAKVKFGKYDIQNKDLHSWVELSYVGKIYIIDLTSSSGWERKDIEMNKYVSLDELEFLYSKKDIQKIKKYIENKQKDFIQEYQSFYGTDYFGFENESHEPASSKN